MESLPQAPSPVRIVGNLDLVGEVFANVVFYPNSVPDDVQQSAIMMLRSLRDEIAHAHGLSVTSVYSTPAFAADMLMDEIPESNQ